VTITYIYLRHEASAEELTSLTGVAQALISILAEEDDKLRSINRGQHKVVFLLKSPLYLFGVSDWNEPEYVVSRCFGTGSRAEEAASWTSRIPLPADHLDRHFDPII